MSIYQRKDFWIGAGERAIKTAAQAGVAALTAAIFTPAGLGAFAIVLGVAVVGSLLTSLARPEDVIYGVTDHESEPDLEAWAEAEQDH